MNLHEYQAKGLLEKHNINIQRGVLVEDKNKALAAFAELREKTNTEMAVVKAQIHAGGRGKGGGIKLAKNENEVQQYVNDILGMQLKTPQTPGGLDGPGKLVRKVLLAEDAYAPDFSACKEYYISILTDRSTHQNVIVHSAEGGMDIEKVAEETPHLVHKTYIHPSTGFMPFHARTVAQNLELGGVASKNMAKFIAKLYDCFVNCDATLIEINPCMINGDGTVTAVDAKMSIDDNALFRHPEIEEMQDTLEMDPTEVEAKEAELNYVKLDGNVGCMVNGAGLAMATMDIIKLSGGNPANFLDVGGTADAARVEQAFRIILKDENVKAILVNIFGGIVRCDRVAQGVVDAYHNMGSIGVPIIVRLQGTNAEEAKKIIDESGLKVYSAIQLGEAAGLVKQILQAS